MTTSIRKGKATPGEVGSGQLDQVFFIDRKPGNFFSLKLKNSSFSPRITVEKGSEVLKQATCYNSVCATGTIDGERFRTDELIARVVSIDGGSGSFKLRLKDHGNLDTITRKVVQLTNRERRRQGLKKLSFNSRLQKAAQSHADDMDQTGRYLAHDSSDGRVLRDRIDDVDYNWSYIAENAASGQASPKAVVQSWMNSPGHRANILNPEIKDIGVGYAIDDVSATPYWVQNFGSSF